MLRGFWDQNPLPSAIAELDFSVLARGNAGDRTVFCQPVAEVVGVVSPICDDGAAFGDIWLKALTCLRNIRPVACGEVQKDRLARAVAHQVKLASS